jgi:hypothetical protein
MSWFSSNYNNNADTAIPPQEAPAPAPAATIPKDIAERINKARAIDPFNSEYPDLNAIMVKVIDSLIIRQEIKSNENFSKDDQAFKDIRRIIDILIAEVNLYIAKIPEITQDGIDTLVRRISTYRGTILDILEPADNMSNLLKMMMKMQPSKSDDYMDFDFYGQKAKVPRNIDSGSSKNDILSYSLAQNTERIDALEKRHTTFTPASSASTNRIIMKLQCKIMDLQDGIRGIQKDIEYIQDTVSENSKDINNNHQGIHTIKGDTCDGLVESDSDGPPPLEPGSDSDNPMPGLIPPME